MFGQKRPIGTGDDMQPDMKPILFQAPMNFEVIEIYVVHDMHYGNQQFQHQKWKKLKDEILARPNRFVIFVGDLMEMAVPGSKSDVFSQTVPPEAQKEWVSYELGELAKEGRVIAVVPGNHEHNRATKLCGLYPLYDACCWARIQDCYRENFAVVDIAMGDKKSCGKQFHYVGFVTHKAKDLRNWSTADTLEGFDFLLYGHDHDPKEHARSHLVYDTKNKQVSTKNIETVNAGSFLSYGGYAARAAYRPPSDKLYKIVLCPTKSREKKIETVGFYV